VYKVTMPWPNTSRCTNDKIRRGVIELKGFRRGRTLVVELGDGVGELVGGLKISHFGASRKMTVIDEQAGRGTQKVLR
jgi:hypothetical protein